MLDLDSEGLSSCRDNIREIVVMMVVVVMMVMLMMIVVMMMDCGDGQSKYHTYMHMHFHMAVRLFDITRHDKKCCSDTQKFLSSLSCLIPHVKWRFDDQIGSSSQHVTPCPTPHSHTTFPTPHKHASSCPVPDHHPNLLTEASHHHQPHLTNTHPHFAPIHTFLLV